MLIISHLIYQLDLVVTRDWWIKVSDAKDTLRGNNKESQRLCPRWDPWKTACHHVYAQLIKAAVEHEQIKKGTYINKDLKDYNILLYAP